MRENPRKNLITISIALAQALCILFIGLTISFFVYYIGLRNPYLNKIPGIVIDPVAYQTFLNRIGYNDPIHIQFINFFFRFFRGDWGVSFVVTEGTPVIDLMRTEVPDTIEIALLPTVIGFGGIKLAKIWGRKDNKIVGKALQIFTIIGLATPVYILGTVLQFVIGLNTDFPVIYRFNPALPRPPYITGFPTFDSMISGNWNIAGDYIIHSILPWFILGMGITPMIIKETRNRIENDSQDVLFTSNSFSAAKIFGYLFTLIFLVEVIFNLTGFGYLFFLSFYLGDIFVIVSCLLIITIFFAFTLFFSNIIPIGYTYLREKATKFFKLFHVEEITEQTRFVGISEEIPKRSSNLRLELKNYVIYTLKNPFTLAGLGIIGFLIFITISPQLLTPYTVDNITPPGFLPETPYLPPSSDHPWGTTKYGIDILARMIWGTRYTFIFGIMVILIGLGIGAQLGYLAGKLHRYVYNGIIGFMIIFFIFPGSVILMISIPFFSFNIPLFILIGILLIPVFTSIVANAVRKERSGLSVFKSIIKYIPLEMALTILLYNSLGFIGITNERIPQLGVDINYGRGHWGAYYAISVPGIFLFLILLGLIFLHEGLKASSKLKVTKEGQIQSI